jgi:hypothetical protein
MMTSTDCSTCWNSKMKKAALTCFLALCLTGLYGQAADTIPPEAAVTDSLQEKGKSMFSWFTNDYPEPKKALLLSIIPGGGQAYNKRWWKIPIVYGALGGMAYLVDFNSTEYLFYKRTYRRKARGLPHDLTGRGGLDNVSVLKRYRDDADRNTQLSYIGFFAVYAMAGIEAFVDSHLMSFDVSDDLSIQLRPSETGVGLTIHF